MACNRTTLMTAARLVLDAIGEDGDREGLQDTPRRFADAWCEFIDYDAGNVQTTFASHATDQMVVVSGMRVWSICEHHLLPFWCEIAVGYITGARVLGLSKFARIAHRRAHALQVQERLVEQIADDVSLIAATPDVAVLARGEHLCMVMRGIQTPAIMTSSAMRGAFKENATTRAEFLRLAADGRT